MEVNMYPNCNRQACDDHSAGPCDNPECKHHYTPKVGDAVSARRRISSKIYANHIVGPVVDVWDNACRIVTNPDTEIEGDFRLYFSDWKFTFLHET
jgi:hypothetical protein